MVSAPAEPRKLFSIMKSVFFFEWIDLPDNKFHVAPTELNDVLQSFSINTMPRWGKIAQLN
jgi:hypothetical protein